MWYNTVTKSQQIINMREKCYSLFSNVKCHAKQSYPTVTKHWTTLFLFNTNIIDIKIASSVNTMLFIISTSDYFSYASLQHALRPHMDHRHSNVNEMSVVLVQVLYDCG